MRNNNEMFYLSDESQFCSTAIFFKILVNNALSVSKNNLLEINISVSELTASFCFFLLFFVFSTFTLPWDHCAKPALGFMLL